jgi:hypothetical protein
MNNDQASFRFVGSWEALEEFRLFMEAFPEVKTELVAIRWNAIGSGPPPDHYVVIAAFATIAKAWDSYLRHTKRTFSYKKKSGDVTIDTQNMPPEQLAENLRLVEEIQEIPPTIPEPGVIRGFAPPQQGGNPN